MILYKKAFRDIKSSLWQSVSIMLVVACGVSILAGVDMAFHSLSFTRDKLYEDLNFADLELLIIPADADTIPDFTDIPGVSHVEKRLIFPGTIRLKNTKRLSGILTLNESSMPDINSFSLTEGRFSSDADVREVMIERGLAKYHGFKPGDPIEIRVGEKTYRSSIAGVVITPEFMTGTTNPDFFAPGKGTLGVLYGNIARSNNALGFTLVNDLLFTYSEGSNVEQVKARILEKATHLNLERIISQKDHFSYKYMELDLNGFKVYIPAIIIIMGALSFTTAFVTYNRFIILQRKEIGILLSLGYNNRDVMRSFLYGAALLGIAGSLLGIGLSFAVRNIFAHVQSLALDLPTLYMQAYAESMLKGVCFGMLSTLIPPFLLLPRLLRISPHEIIRESPKVTAKNKVLHGLWGRSSWMGLEFRYALRNMGRQKWLTISTVICIGLALGVAISYITSVTSVNKTITNSFTGEHWDLAVDYLYAQYIDDTENMKKIDGIIQGEPFIRKFVEIEAPTGRKDANLLGISPGSGMKRVRLIDGAWFSGDHRREIIVNHDITAALGIGVGDEVDIKVNRKRFPFTVVGISAEFSVGQALVPFTVAQEVFHLATEATGMFLTLSEHADAETIKTALSKMEYVGRVTEKREILGELLDLMRELMGIVYISTAFSIAVAVIFIYTNVNLSIFERKGELALLKSLGYGDNSIRKIVLSQILITGSLGAVVSIPVAVVMAIVLNDRLEKAWYHVDNYFVIFDFVWILLAALVLMPLMAIPAVRHMHRLNISEILHQKNIE